MSESEYAANNTLSRHILKKWQINAKLTARQAADHLKVDIDTYWEMLDGTRPVPQDLITAIGQQVILFKHQTGKTHVIY